MRCTAWLVGNKGHVLTNHHCIGSAEEVKDLQFEAMGEGKSCDDDCRSALACPGAYVHTKPLEFIATGGSLEDDWTLLRLPKESRRAALQHYGYLRIRASGPVVGEEIYMIGHPNGYGKRIAYVDGDKSAKILSISENSGCGKSDVIYRLDSEGGSSGSPVFGAKDGLVVGLHHCGGCKNDVGNSAIDIRKLDAVAKKYLPNSAYA
jgi:V8-like Glu-specific endopeptidase